MDCPAQFSFRCGVSEFNSQNNSIEKTTLWSSLSAGARSKCPNCGKGSVFDGFLTVGKNCSSCGLDLPHDTGDGPAVFIILIVGAIVVGGALVVEVKYAPAYWIHAVLWLPAMLGLSLALLRPCKAILLALQYHYKAEEGRQKFDDDHRVS